MTLEQRKAELPNYALIDDLAEGLHDYFCEQRSNAKYAMEAAWQQEAKNSEAYKAITALNEKYDNINFTVRGLFSKGKRKLQLKKTAQEIFNILSAISPQRHNFLTGHANIRRRGQEICVDRLVDQWRDQAPEIRRITKDEIKAKLLLTENINNFSWKELVEYVQQ